MPRKDSRAEWIRVGSEYLAHRVLARWQHLLAAGQPRGVADPELSWPDDKYDSLTDRFIGVDENGMPTKAPLEEIRTYVSRHLPDDELEEMADFARRKPYLRPEGRPEAAWDLYLVQDIEEQRLKHEGTPAGSVRAICTWLVNNVDRYRGMKPSTLRGRYDANKKKGYSQEESVP